MSRFDGLYPMRNGDRCAILSIGVLDPGAMHVIEAVAGEVFVTEGAPEEAWEIGVPLMDLEEGLEDATARLWCAIQSGADFHGRSEDLERWVLDGEWRRPVAFNVMLAAALVLLSIAFFRDD
jgi:hypothetical protein